MIEDIIECQRLADIVNDERLHEVSRCQIMKAFLFDRSIPFRLVKLSIKSTSKIFLFVYDILFPCICSTASSRRGALDPDIMI